MKCNEIDLIGYMDGHIHDREILKHISECPDCADEIKRLSYSSKLLQSYFSKQLAQCPQYSKIVDLFYYELPSAETKKILGHVKLCKKCSALYDTLRLFEQGVERSADKFDPALFPLSESLKAQVHALHDKSIANRLKKTVKLITQRSSGTKKWIQEILDSHSLSESNGEPVFASRKDLVEVKKSPQSKKRKAKRKKI